MALEEKKNDSITGASTINGVVVERYSAQINAENPESMVLTRTITNPQLRKDNREQCRADQAQFEDDCYEIQNGMIEANAVKQEVAGNEDD